MICALLIAIAAGFCLAGMGIAICAGTARGAHLSQLYLVIGVAGCIFFATRATGETFPPAIVVLLAMAGSLSQYASLHCLRSALAQGPITAVWSAAALGFLPVSIYAAVKLGESFMFSDIVSLAAGVGCVLLASTLQDGSRSGTAAIPHRPLHFAALLFGLLLLNGLLSIFIKQLATISDANGASLLARHQYIFLALVYAGLVTCLGFEQILTRRPWACPGPSFRFGLVAAVGSMSALWLLGRVAHHPATFVFTTCTMAQIAGTFLLAAVLLGEKCTRRWFAVIGLAMLSILASQAEFLWRVLICCGGVS